MDFQLRKKTLYHDIPVDLNMVKEFNNKYEAYKQLRLRNGDDDLYNEKQSDASYRSSRGDLDDEGLEPPKEDLEDELYLTRKRQRIKFQYLRQIDPNAKLVLPLKHDKLNIFALKRFNNIFVNFKARSKETLPPIFPATMTGYQPTEFLKIKNNPNVIKKRAQGMAIYRLKEGQEQPTVKISKLLDTGIPEYDKSGFKSARHLTRKTTNKLLNHKESGVMKSSDQIDSRGSSLVTLKSKGSILSIKTPMKRATFLSKEAKTAR